MMYKQLIPYYRPIQLLSTAYTFLQAISCNYKEFILLLQSSMLVQVVRLC